MKKTITFLSTRAAVMLLIMLLTTATAWAQWSGSGTSGDPYLITNADDLKDLAVYVNGTGIYSNGITETTAHDCSGVYFQQTYPITLTGDWTPIGNSSHTFKGNYNGGDNTISGLTVSGSYKSAGLFGNTYYNSSQCVLQNIIVKDCNIDVSGTDNSDAGGIVGYASDYTFISNCRVSGTIKAQHSAGGIAGYLWTVTNGHISKISQCFADVTVAATTKGKLLGRGAGGDANYDPSVFNNKTSHYHADDSGVTAFGQGADNTYSVPVYAVKGVPSGVTVAETNASVTFIDTPYFASGATATLTVDDANKMFKTFSVSGATYSLAADKKSATVTFGTSDVTVSATTILGPDFADNEDGSYTIKNATGWGVFCDLLADNDKGYFTGKTVKLDDDISVTRMAGSDGHDFTGTFNGQGYKLTVNYEDSGDNTRTAPFAYVDGATIQNLIVDGTINDNGYRAAGLIGETGTTTSHIINCVSSLTISGGRYTGGFSIGGNVEIEGCVFNGTINGNSLSGGFVGYSNSALKITNCLFAPQSGSSISGGTFYFNGSAGTLTNSYYTAALGTAQGKQARSITAGEHVRVTNAGTATNYSVSGITSYGTGIKYGDVLYAGSGDAVSLRITPSMGYQCSSYTASAGTLSGNSPSGDGGASYTLTMPDADVTISATSIIENEGDGTAEHPYVIYDWDTFCDWMTYDYDNSKDKHYKLGADVSATKMVGNESHPFCGAFDGQGHTLTVDYSATADYCAPFRDVSGGTSSAPVLIKNLHVAGSITTTKVDAVGIVGRVLANGYLTIENCRSSVDIESTYEGNGRHSGFVSRGAEGATISIRGSVFDGSINAANSGQCAGFFASKQNHSVEVTIENCLFAPTAITVAGNENKTFARGSNNTITNCYYTQVLGTAQGKALCPAPASPAGQATHATYDVSGITPYANGLQRVLDDHTTAFYYGAGDNVSVSYIDASGTLCDGLDGHPDPHQATALGPAHMPATLAANYDSDNDQTPDQAWYYIADDITYTQTVTLAADAHLILADGKTMNVGTSKSRISDGNCFDSGSDDNKSLTIYGQSDQSGKLNAYNSASNKYAVYVKNYAQHGGNVTIDASNNHALVLNNGNLTLIRGALTVNASGSSRAISLDAGYTVTVSGGTLNATATNDYAIHGRVTMTGGTLTANGTVGITRSVTMTGGTLTANGTTTGTGSVTMTGGTLTANGKYGINGSVTFSGGNLTATGTTTGIRTGTGTISLSWTSPDDHIYANSYYGTVKVADGQSFHNGSEVLAPGTVAASDYESKLNGKTLIGVDVLEDAAANDVAALATSLGGKQTNIALNGRTLYKDGAWNTLCLPFAVSTTSGPLSGDNVTAMVLRTSDSGLSGTTLTLNFDDAPETIPAGTPFIIKWDNTGENLVNPVFSGVTVDDTNRDVNFTGGSFLGTYSPVILEANDRSKLYLGAANKLYWPSANKTIGSCRAYFELSNGVEAREFVLNFGDEEATGIMATDYTIATPHSQRENYTDKAGAGWYDMQGRKLQGQPTAKGLYIHNGKKVVIK